MLARGRAPSGRAAAGAHHARRAVAVRPPRPLLRARADPERVPPAVRPARHAPRPHQAAPHGGLNPSCYNAVTEGGPRNGVMTALDDFIAEYDRPLRRRRAPDLLRAGDRRRGDAGSSGHPELARVLDRLEGAEGKDDAARARRVRRASRRCSSSTTSFSHREGLLERAAARYLRAARRPRCSTSTTSRTRCASSTSPTCIDEKRVDRGDQAARPGAADAGLQAVETAERRAARAGRRAGSFLPYTDMGRARLERISKAALERRAPESVDRRPRRVRHRARRRRDLHARLPRGARDARSPGLGGRHRSSVERHGDGGPARPLVPI